MKMTSFKADSRLQLARKNTIYIFSKQMPSKFIRIIQHFQGFKYTHCHDKLWLFKANNLISLYHKSIIILTFCMQTDNFIFCKACPLYQFHKCIWNDFLLELLFTSYHLKIHRQANNPISKHIHYIKVSTFQCDSKAK